MFNTTRQKEVLEAQTPRYRSQKIPSDRLGISESAIHSVNSDVFNNFVEALELMADPDYFQIFEGRFKKHKTEIWSLTRQIRTLMKDL